MAAIRAWLLIVLLACVCFAKENNATDLGYGTLKRGDGVPCGPGHEKDCHPHPSTGTYRRSCSKLEHCRDESETSEGN